jgi:glucosamine kinase
MILVADSGSTKTDWRLVDEKKKVHHYSTIGLNPYFQTSEQISQEIQRNLVSYINDDELVSSDLDLFFYGAGCSNISMCKTVEKALKNNFPNANIEVHHDLLAAAKALCGPKEGIAAILGTGSNSCYYNGKDIVENIPALGYVLGDEGSGAHIGKTFITSYLNGELPKHISESFYEKYTYNKGDILEHIYRKPLPNKFLAAFSTFILENIHEPYLLKLVTECFELFFEKHICKYPKHKEVNFNCVGSVGYYYKNILQSVANKKGCKVDKIMETPIAALTEYHINH